MQDAGDPRSILVANERAKLSATYVNGVAIAILAVGGLARLFAQRSPAPSPTDQFWLTPAILRLCLCVSGTLHWAARSFLRELL